MKLVFIALMATVLSTVDVYAATTNGESTPLGCTGTMVIGSPTSSTTAVGWMLNGRGEVVGAEVTWTPGESSHYSLVVTVGSSTGSLSIANSDITARTDSVLISPPVSAENANSASLIILQGINSSTGSQATVGWKLNSKPLVSPSALG